MRILSVTFLAVLLTGSAVAVGQDSLRTSYNDGADKARMQGKNDEAERLFRSAMKEAESIGKQDAIYSLSLLGLGMCYQAKGKYAESEQLFKQSLRLTEQLEGAESHNVTVRLTHLAILFEEQGKYAEAESFFKRSLLMNEKTLGAEHLFAINDRDILAGFYKERYRYTEAEQLIKRNLQIAEKLSGSASQKLGYSLRDLAQVYDIQGKYADAEPLFKRSLQIFEKELGADDSEVATSLSFLSVLRVDREEFVEAEALKRRVIEIQQKAEHPSLAYSKRSLARILACQDKQDEARPLLATALEILRKRPRTGDSKVALATNARANERYEAGRYFEASRLYHLAANSFERALGPDDINVATSQEACAKALRKLGREKEATVREAEASAIRARATK